MAHVLSALGRSFRLDTKPQQPPALTGGCWTFYAKRDCPVKTHPPAAPPRTPQNMIPAQNRNMRRSGIPTVRMNTASMTPDVDANERANHPPACNRSCCCCAVFTTSVVG